MQCPDCGAFISEEDLFCGECGRPLAEGAPPAKPLSPLEAKDLPTVSVERPPRAPTPARATPLPERRRFPLAPVLLMTVLGLLLLCLLAGGALFWVGSKVSSTATPVEGGPEQRALLYEEDFGDPASGWSVLDENDTRTSYTNGEYRLEVYQANYMVWGNPDPGQEFADSEVEVETRQVEGPLDNNYGLVIRYEPDGDSFYWFEISSDGYYSVDLRQGSEWITLLGWQASDAIQQGVGATNRLKVVCQGERFSFYVNDIYLTDLTDSTLSSGQVGLAVGTFDEPGVVVHFDNLKVYTLQE